MNETTTPTRSIIVEREIHHPPEKLWRALTQPHLLQEWLMKNDFEPTVGHRFQLRRTPQPDMDIVIDCEVLKVEPMKTLSYAWDYIVGDPKFDLRSVVTFTLTPTPVGTHLRMEQTGFRPDMKQAFAGGNYAWSEYLNALEELLGRTD